MLRARARFNYRLWSCRCLLGLGENIADPTIELLKLLKDEDGFLMHYVYVHLEDAVCHGEVKLAICRADLSFLLRLCWGTEPRERPKIAEVVTWLQDPARGSLVRPSQGSTVPSYERSGTEVVVKAADTVTFVVGGAQRRMFARSCESPTR